MAGDAAATPEYDAFVSYSRRDIAFARALEKALKAYRPPRDLAVPQRYLRVFRDEADFTGAEYTRAIRRHLEASRALIVVCSPAARASRYVDEEIRLFAESHGAATIIPVLVGGVPNNEAGPGRESELAFPDALLRLMAMPLAVEYRGVDAGRARLDRGAQEGSWFKLLADLYGLSRHEVEQREKRRQARTRRRWIGGTAVVMASLVALSVWALVSRAEAIRQREIAAAGLVTAQARALVGPETEVAERQALLALEALRRLRQHGAATDEADAVLATALGRLPQRVHAFDAQRDPPLVSFSADGLRLFRVVGSRLELWNLRTLRAERTVDVETPVSRIDASPDGQWLAVTAGRGAVSMHFVGEPSPRGPAARAAGSPVASASLGGAFSRDGRLYASLHATGATGHEVVVWQPADGAVRARLALPVRLADAADAGEGPRLVFSAARDLSGFGSPLIVLVTFTPAGATTATALAWRVPPAPSAAGATRAPSPPGSPAVRSWPDVTGAGFDPDGTRLLLTRAGPAGGPGDLVSISPSDWREGIVKLSQARTGPVSADGRRFLTDGTLFEEDPYVPLLRTTLTEVRDTIDGSVRVELPIGGRFSTDGKRFIARDGSLIRLWDLGSGQEVIRLFARKPVSSLVDAPGGRYLALVTEDGSVDIWDTGHPQESSRIAGRHTGRLSGQGRFITVTGPAGSRLVEVATGRSMARLQPPGDELDLVVSPDGTRAMGPFLPDGRIVLVDAATLPKRLLDLVGDRGTLWEDVSAVRAAFSPDGSMAVVAHADGVLRALRAVDGREIWKVSFTHPAAHLYFASDGQSVLVDVTDRGVARGGGDVVLLDAGTGSVRRRVPAQRPTALATDATGRRLALASAGTVAVFDTAGAGPATEIVHPTTLDHVGAIAFLPDGRRLATVAGSRASTFLGASFYTEQAAFVWDLSSRQMLARIPSGRDRATDYPETLAEEEKAYLQGATLSRDGRALGGTLYRSRRDYWIVKADRVWKDAVVWDLTGPLPREILRQPGADVQGVSSGMEAVLLDSGNALQVWSPDRSNLANAACARLSRDLDAGEWKAYFPGQPYRATCGRPGSPP